MKKPRLLTLATSCGLALLAVYTTVGCGRLDRTRHPPEENGSDIVVPKAPEKMDTDPKTVRAQLKRSVHADLNCSGCHAPPAKGKQPDELGKAQCTNCHADESKAYAETIHATANAENGGEGAATCEDCHGMHDTRRVSDPQSRVSPRNTPATCGQCHDNPELAEKLGIKKPKAVKHYAESIHGRELVTHGLLVAPSCADCHGKAHHIFEAKDPRSTVPKSWMSRSTLGAAGSNWEMKNVSAIRARTSTTPPNPWAKRCGSGLSAMTTCLTRPAGRSKRR